MPNGLNTEQMVERMYAELVGLDGNSGLVRDMAETKVRVDTLEGTAVTKEECIATRKRSGERRDKVLMRVKDILLILISAASLLLATGVF